MKKIFNSTEWSIFILGIIGALIFLTLNIIDVFFVMIFLLIAILYLTARINNEKKKKIILIEKEIEKVLKENKYKSKYD